MAKLLWKKSHRQKSLILIWSKILLKSLSTAASLIFLTNVYSNVLTFKTTGCQASKKKLVVEGVINFKSGKTKATKFTFTKTAEGLIEGVNPTLASEKAFILTCKQLPNKKLLQVESIAYKYKIGDNLVEGLAVK